MSTSLPLLFSDLPQELLHDILIRRLLDHRDVCRFGSVCRMFREVASNRHIWKLKFRQRWPDLFPKILAADPSDWKDEFIARHQSDARVLEVLNSIAESHYTKLAINESSVEPFVALSDGNHHGILYVQDVLFSIISDKSSPNLLTLKYYASKVLSSLKQETLRKELNDFLALPEDQQQLQRAAVITSQWCQVMNTVTQAQVSSQLDSIAWRVLERLAADNINHRLYSNDVPASQKRKILDAVNYVLYKEMGFQGNQRDYYHINNSFIDKVLETKKGIPISLCIIYSEVARRVGVTCEPINFPSHFLLRWDEHPELSDEERFTYIDAFHGGVYMTQHECTKLTPSVAVAANAFQVASCSQVLQRMVRNLVVILRESRHIGHSFPLVESLKNVAELQCHLEPYSAEACVLFARISLHLGVNHLQCIQKLKSLQPMSPVVMSLLRHHERALRTEREEDEEEDFQPKKRSEHPEVEYSIGAVMKHRRYDYICVIYGWDETCKASDSWILQMGVHQLPKKQFQPFYNVLVSDGSSRYAAQENLEIAPEPENIAHEEVGRHFCNYNGLCYEPNDSLRLRYPEDQPANTTSESGDGV